MFLVVCNNNINTNNTNTNNTNTINTNTNNTNNTMDTKIYTPSVTRQNKSEINIQQISNENDIKRYLSYVYQEYGDIYELNAINDTDTTDTTHSTHSTNNATGARTPELSESSESIATRVNNFFVAQQSQSLCTISSFCIYFLYLAATSVISLGISCLTTFLLFNTNYKILVVFVLFILIETVFLACLPLVKKIKSSIFDKREVIYDV